MRNRRPRAARADSPIERLRLAIDCMPLDTRRAMLAGLRANERIIAGAYVDGQGGVCPMLAAHRQGGRTDFLTFARCWDRFTRAGKHSRAATARELRILVAQLEASVTQDSGLGFDTAIAEHRTLVVAEKRRLARTRAVPAEADAARARARRLPDRVDPKGWIVARRLRRRRDERRSDERLSVRA